MLAYSVEVEFERTSQVLKEKEYFFVVWFHIVNLLFLLFFYSDILVAVAVVTF